jgi:putative methyltransferase (TIGR04325 family)
MKMPIRHKECSPPPSTHWRGDYPDWNSARAAATGYDHKEILEKIQAAAIAVRDGKALWDRDSVLFYHEEYNLPLVASLMSVAAWNGGRLCVLDFGGGLGCTYVQHRVLLDALPFFSWNIVEQPHFVRCGRDGFAGDRPTFWNSMEECAAAVGRPDVILFSGVLQYLDEPYAALNTAAALASKAIIVDRTCFSENGERFTVEFAPQKIYAASYACRLLDKKRVLNALEPAAHVASWWNSAVDPVGFYGFFAFRKEARDV